VDASGYSVSHHYEGQWGYVPAVRGSLSVGLLTAY